MSRSVLISLILAILALVWILTGSIETAEDKAPEAAVEPTSESDAQDVLFKVQVKHLEAETMQDLLTLQGQIEANRVVELKAEEVGVVNKIIAEKGKPYSKGQALLALDLSDRIVRLETAKAELRVQELELESGRKLLARKMISANQHEQNLANVARARAQVKAIQVEIDNTILPAPFDGVLNDLHVEIGDYVSHGDPLAQFVDNNMSLISVEVPQQYIARIEIGQTVEAELLDGQSLTGKITYVSSTANEATRTFRVEAEASNSGTTYFGQSARVVITLGELMAHKISPSLLGLNSAGDLEIKTVDDEQMVVVHPVEIVRSENDGVWLKGLPESLQLITVGQGFVAEGQLVESVNEGEASL